MPDITADQLAERIEDATLSDGLIVQYMTRRQWDHIIAALRISASHDATCDRQWIAGCQAGWNFACANRHDLFIAAIEGRMNEIAYVKAAVEREVGNV